MTAWMMRMENEEVTAMKPTLEKPKRFDYGNARFCRQTMAGGVGLPKICLLNFECRHCAFDQWLDHLEIVTVAGSANGRAVGAAAVN